MDEPRPPRRLPLALIPAGLALVGLVLTVWFLREPEVESRRVLAPRLRMLELTNADRVAHDLDPLALNRHVSRHATRHTRAMRDAGYIFHSKPRELRRYLRGFEWNIIGENIGVGGSLASLEEAFMQSEVHRENILNPKFEHLAVGVIRTEEAVWVTVIYYG